MPPAAAWSLMLAVVGHVMKRQRVATEQGSAQDCVLQLHNIVRMNLQVLLRPDGSPAFACAFLCLPLIHLTGSRRPSHVLMMQPTDARDLDYPALARPLHGSVLGCVFDQR